MNYLTAAHRVGDLVYAYRPHLSAVQRMRVTAIRALCVTPGYSPAWVVTYDAIEVDGPVDGESFTADQLFTDPARAFPEIVSAAPVAELESA